MGAGAPRRRVVHRLRLLAATALILPQPRHRTDPAALAGRIHREDAAAGGLAARDHRSRRSRAFTTRRAGTARSRQRLFGGRHRQSARCEPGRFGREHRQPGREAACARRPGRRRSCHVSSCATQLAGIPGAQYEFSAPVAAHARTPVEVILAGYDLERLRLVASAVRARMEAVGAFKDIRSSIEGGHPEIQILFDQERASQLGLAVRDIADRVVSQRARRRGDALSPAGKEDRRAGSQRRLRAPPRSRKCATSSSIPDRHAPGAAVRGRRSAPRDGTGGNPPRQPGTRRGDLRGAGGRRPGRCHGRDRAGILAQTTLPVGIMRLRCPARAKR